MDEYHDMLVRNLAVGAQAAVVFPDYRRAPEAQYPSQIEEAHATATWIVEHEAEHGLDSSHLAIAGDSVGGNMTIAVTLMAKQRGGPSFAARRSAVVPLSLTPVPGCRSPRAAGACHGLASPGSP
jgi:acetyl esterase